MSAQLPHTLSFKEIRLRTCALTEEQARENRKAVADYMLAHPEEVEMGCVTACEDPELRCLVNIPWSKAAEHPCGTKACIAGHTLALAPNVKALEDDSRGYFRHAFEDVAGALLGLTEPRGDKVFYGTGIEVPAEDTDDDSWWNAYVMQHILPYWARGEDEP